MQDKILLRLHELYPVRKQKSFSIIQLFYNISLQHECVTDDRDSLLFVSPQVAQAQHMTISTTLSPGSSRFPSEKILGTSLTIGTVA